MQSCPNIKKMGLTSKCMAVTIRAVTTKDWPALATFLQQEFSQKPWNEKATVKGIQKSFIYYYGQGLGYIALDKKQIVASIGFMVEPTWTGKALKIYDVAVNKDYRRQGIGKKLMRKVEKYAKEHNIGEIYFSTKKKSVAEKFYYELGYEAERDTVCMRKKLKKQ